MPPSSRLASPLPLAAPPAPASAPDREDGGGSRRRVAARPAGGAPAPAGDGGHFRAAIDGSLDAWWFLRAVRDADARVADFVIVDLNPGAEALIGVPRAALVGGRLAERAPSLCAGALLGRYARVVDEERVYDGEHAVPWEAGGARWHHVHAVPIPGGVAVCLRDVSERKRTDSAHARFAAILEATPDVVAIMSVDGRLLSVNRAGRALMGLPLAGDGADPTDVAALGLRLADIQPQLAPGGPMRHAVDEADRDGVWRGETTLRKRDGREIAVEQVLLAHRDAAGAPEFYSALMRDITDRKQAEAALRALSLVDELTGLYNRRGFLTVAGQAHERAQGRGAPVLVFYLDVDCFKAVNDRFGHPEGDAALATLADVLRRTFRESDVVARLGGDEFVAFAVHGAGQSSVAIARAVVSRLQRQLDAVNASGAHPWRLEVSVGVAWDAHGGTDGPMTLDALLAEADAMLYEEKCRRKAGRGG